MSVSTHGMRIRTPSLALRAAVELLSSMRFSISLLTVICVASVIGTVLKQGEPLGNYVNQFGPFWAEVFGNLSLFTVYSAWWFMLILGFLVVSTTLCVTRNVPHILRDWSALKESIREKSLQSFGQRASGVLSEAHVGAAQRIGQTLAASGWKVKIQTRDSGVMVAAKAGSANKLGYIAAHSAIVLVCVGGLLDGDLAVRAQTWFNGKSVYTGGGMIADVPAAHRLSPDNLAFRANLLVAEGARSSTAILNQPSGVLIQDLPFSIELKKFIVEHYSTGMPKLFASEIIIHDKDTGAQTTARVEVNHPTNYRGVEIYQSSFDDGGSSVKLRAVPMGGAGAAKAFDIEGVIGGSSNLSNGDEKMTLEYSALRVLNVENFGKEGAASPTAVDVRKVDIQQSMSNLGSGINERLGAANKVKTRKELRNVGPSITYKLRDAAGQAREFHNYMLPVKIEEDGGAVYMLGMRDSPAEAFRYLRIPVDAEGNMDGFLRLKAALQDPAARELAVKRYVKLATDPAKPELGQQLGNSAARALGLFAGLELIKGKPSSGLQAVADFMEANVPEAERERASGVLVRILNGVLFELAQLTREQAGLKAMPPDEATQAFMTQAVLSLSDAFFYPAPMAFMLSDFKQVQASVFQVARAPGKWIVYTGCLFLIIGVFAMLYIRERRIWVWLTPDEASGQSKVAMAMSANRKSMDGDKEFAMLKTKLLGL
jgi:cytochrome c biogenesis protein